MAVLLRICTMTATAVMFFTVLVYLAITIPILIIHETVPSAPNDPIQYNGLNMTEAWLDLAELTNGYHPYNSRRNDEVHDWLLRRIESILGDNNIDWSAGKVGHIQQLPASDVKDDIQVEPFLDDKGELRSRKASSPLVTIFNDLQSNVTCSASGALITTTHLPGQTVYFEGTNIIVYIRGTEDEEGEWWEDDLNLNSKKTHGHGGVLVNAHYDSVSTGFGATDDGVGVITILQLIRYFTTSGNRPKKGIIALFNNGEEDFLNGARAYTQHPMSLFTHTFLNLEGAGAGGRAVLFRSTDAEITKSYAKSPNPFGTIIAGDGFKQGYIASQTDYVVFQDTLGLRGLDVAFWNPRARYHTDQDDRRHTTKDSIWHMVSASVATVKSLSNDMMKNFNGPRGDRARGMVQNGKGSNGVWFDLFGKGFAVFGLRTLFAWSLTFLIACPLAIILITYLLIQKDKFYFFSGTTEHGDSGHEGEHITLNGWKGATRWPIALAISAALTFGSGLLIAKINPLVVYSSQYSVWIMMLSLNFCVFWFILRGADFARPSALTRGYAYMWMFFLGWCLLVGVTVLEDRYNIGSGYIFVFYEVAVFVALIISLMELFLLPTKAQYASAAHAEHDTVAINEALPDSDQLIAPTQEELPEEELSTAAQTDGPAQEEPTEDTPLLGGDGSLDSTATTFANYARRSFGGASSADGPTDSRRDGPAYRHHLRRLSHALTDHDHRPYGHEQGWSAKLPRWTWLIQFLIVGPFVIILLEQAGLLIVTAIGQTGPDGSSLVLPYMVAAAISVLLLLPTTPTLHRFTYHIPSVLLLAFIGTLIYNLVAFPFSANNRYKAYFQQTVDLSTGTNIVTFAGLEQYIRPIIASIPSAAGQQINCESRAGGKKVSYCTYTGIPPRVIPIEDSIPAEASFKEWLSYSATRQEGTNSATFVVKGNNTRACSIRFDRPVKFVKVHGAGSDDRFDTVPDSGSKEVKLWHRNWDESWTVDVEWPVGDGKGMGEEGMEGRVVCLWSDANKQGVIPSLEEARRFVPEWVGISKLSDGLVEGWVPFNV